MAMIMLVPSVEDGKFSFTLGVENHIQSLSSWSHERKLINQGFRNNKCIGSSHGWLILLKDNQSPFLLYTFTGGQIQLPTIHFDPTIIQKAVLSGDPNLGTDFTVFILYGLNSNKLAFFKKGMDGWFCSGDKPICDIMCHGKYLYALGEGRYIEVWEYIDFPPKKVDNIEVSFQQKTSDTCNSLRDVCTCRMYFLVSDGQNLLVMRFVGEHVREDGVPVHEADLDDRVLPYRTVKFIVLEMNGKTFQWEEVETIGDRVMFLGRNLSIAVSSSNVGIEGCDVNSIYFTDDYVDRFDEDDYLYGGHDMGVYNIGDGSFKQFYERDSLGKINPSPVWAIHYGDEIDRFYASDDV